MLKRVRRMDKRAQYSHIIRLPRSQLQLKDFIIRRTIVEISMSIITMAVRAVRTECIPQCPPCMDTKMDLLDITTDTITTVDSRTFLKETLHLVVVVEECMEIVRCIIHIPRISLEVDIR